METSLKITDVKQDSENGKDYIFVLRELDWSEIELSELMMFEKKENWEMVKKTILPVGKKERNIEAAIKALKVLANYSTREEKVEKEELELVKMILNHPKVRLYTLY